MNSRTAGRLLSGGGISQRERRVPGGPFDCGASFIVIVGNEVGTIVVSVYILLTPCHAHTRAARSLARSRHILHPSPNHFVYLVVQRLPLWADANSIARIYMCPGCRFKPPPIYSNAIFGRTQKPAVFLLPLKNDVRQLWIEGKSNEIESHFVWFCLSFFIFFIYKSRADVLVRIGVVTMCNREMKDAAQSADRHSNADNVWSSVLASSWLFLSFFF